jgi:hypothetical protein
VSRRLVEESKARQVIVFTHEMVFLAALLQEAERQGVTYAAQTISRGSDFLSGHVDKGLPWTGLPTQKRINALKQECQRAEKIYREEGQKAYEPVATRMYADLRRTWERAIEEVLLNEVVLRFRQGIETNRLKSANSQAHGATLRRVMGPGKRTERLGRRVPRIGKLIYGSKLTLEHPRPEEFRRVMGPAGHAA